MRQGLQLRLYKTLEELRAHLLCRAWAVLQELNLKLVQARQRRGTDAGANAVREQRIGGALAKSLLKVLEGATPRARAIAAHALIDRMIEHLAGESPFENADAVAFLSEHRARRLAPRNEIKLPATERRSARRYEMKIPLVVRWINDSAAGEAVTKSKNVSMHAVYFFLPKEVKKGSAMEIVMTLPHMASEPGPVRVRCLARVQRTESHKAGKVGIVVAIERYEFLRAEENVK